MMIINLKRSVCDDKSEVLKIYEQLTQNIVKRRIRESTKIILLIGKN